MGQDGSFEDYTSDTHVSWPWSSTGGWHFAVEPHTYFGPSTAADGSRYMFSFDCSATGAGFFQDTGDYYSNHVFTLKALIADSVSVISSSVTFSPRDASSNVVLAESIVSSATV